MSADNPNGSASNQNSNGKQSAGEDALDKLFWRDEILQVMYWLQGEGLSESVRAQDLMVFLNSDIQTILFHLELAAAEGYLTRSPNTNSMDQSTTFALSDTGRKEGGRRFRDEFAGMQKSGHGECSADCICHTTGDHASCPTHGHAH
ncbi:MAG: hypothetical protein AAF702_26215 [Chloroflexota bacterium]